MYTYRETIVPAITADSHKAFELMQTIQTSSRLTATFVNTGVRPNLKSPPHLSTIPQGAKTQAFSKRFLDVKPVLMRRETTSAISNPPQDFLDMQVLLSQLSTLTIGRPLYNLDAQLQGFDEVSMTNYWKTNVGKTICDTLSRERVGTQRMTTYCTREDRSANCRVDIVLETIIEVGGETRSHSLCTEMKALGCAEHAMWSQDVDSRRWGDLLFQVSTEVRNLGSHHDH